MGKATLSMFRVASAFALATLMTPHFCQGKLVHKASSHDRHDGGSHRVQRLMWSASCAIVRRKLRTLIVVSAVLGGLASSWAAAPDRVLLITLRGGASAARSGPGDYREAGSWLVRWLVPRSQLTVGRRFLSTSAVVIGTTRAHGGSVSCRGTLAAPCHVRAARSAPPQPGRNSF
jgi:hypothetical protein